MLNEAIELFDFPRKDISVCGIPRFDNHFNRKGLRDRDTFFESLQLDIHKKLITYTTGNRDLVLPPGDETSAEVDIAKQIANAINQGLLGDAQLLIRLHPLARPSEFEPLRELDNVTIQTPGQVSAFRDRLFSGEDDRKLAETMLHSDVILNVASTMTIDAAVFDTPSISIAFDVRGPLPIHQSVKRIYEYEHYRKLRATGGVHMVASVTEMIQEITQYLSDPSINSDARAEIVQQQCKFKDGRSGERVASAILKYLDGAHAGGASDGA